MEMSKEASQDGTAQESQNLSRNVRLGLLILGTILMIVAALVIAIIRTK